MNKESGAGKQLSSSELHNLQVRKKQIKDGPVVVADGITDPFNMGSILRCSEAIGCKKVYFVDASAAAEKKVIKTSRNAVNVVPHDFLSMREFLSLAGSLHPLIALEVTTHSTDIFMSKYQKEAGFVIGSENKGVSEEILEICQTAVHLPMMGINSSINVANALCVALYDWQRRYRY